MCGCTPWPTGKSHQITHSLVAGVRAEDMVEPFLVHYPSRDGKWTISAFVYVPYNMARNGQNAAIVYVHGGPTSQTVNSFNRIMQHMVNQGYMVIAPNYRGSTGYGKEFSRPTCSTWAEAICRTCSPPPTGSSRRDISIPRS